MAAADPASQVWLSASAGTGKTQVLTARVIRLLLTDGVRPENLLCITYTKAGAAEMANRINRKLARWVQMEDASLSGELQEIGAPASINDLPRARQLFSNILEAPGGGLNITTIHSLCQSLLASFPQEAGLTPGFRPVEGREEIQLRRDILGEMISEAEERGDHILIETLQNISVRHDEDHARKFLEQCVRNAQVLEALPTLLSEAVNWVRGHFGVGFDGSAHSMLEDALSDGAIDRAAIDAVIEMNIAWGTSRAATRIDKIRSWLAMDSATRATNVALLHSAWSTTKNEHNLSKNYVPSGPAYESLTLELFQWTRTLIEQAVLADYSDLLAAALLAGRAFAERYSRGKRERGLIDYDDMIRKTLDLLGTQDMAAWVRYKIDQRIDHVLVDEAQDTNAAQWAIISAFTEDFATGLGAKGEKLRTIFSVGDHKQAIFGFQGTDPETYENAGREYEDVLIESDSPLQRFDLAQSYRSTKPILDYVNNIIDHIGGEALGIKDSIAPHRSELGDYGLVELHPLVGGKPAVKSDADKEASVDGEDDWISVEKRELADGIAEYVKALVDEAPWLGSKGRPLRPGDIMILLRRRGDLAAALVSRLHGLGVAVAGIDRLKIHEPIAVQDLLACIRFVLQPKDEYSLACLLVSPLFGWSQAKLLEIGYRPNGVNLWKHLTADDDLKHELEPLHAMLRVADYTTTYAFLENILSGPMAGRRKFISRLGSETLVPIEELLNVALQFEQNGGGTLQQFLHWFEQGESEIKREGESDDENPSVRVMTVHGAKGLQAPVVILADIASDPTKKPDRLLAIRREAGRLPLLPVKKENRIGKLGDYADMQQSEEIQEHFRLLYVAVTRAEERLVLMGSLSSKLSSAPVHSWHPVLAAAMQNADDGIKQRIGSIGISKAKAVRKTVEQAEAIAIPSWLQDPAPVEPVPPRPLAPSRIDDDAYGEAPASADMRQAAERGKLIHAMFERITGGADDLELAANWLARQKLTAGTDPVQLLASVRSVVLHPDWQGIFGPDARSEMPFAAVVSGQVITGRVDRILIGERSVHVLDFKTGRGVPKSEDGVNVAHLRQMAHYVSALEAIFPNRSVSASILYTHAPRMIELSAALMAKHRPDMRS